LASANALSLKAFKSLGRPGADVQAKRVTCGGKPRLFICGMDDPPVPAPSPDAVASLALAMLGLVPPEECIEGVRSNLMLLAEHRRILEDER